MYIQIIRHLDMDQSTISHHNYQEDSINDINFKYFFGESKEKTLNFSFEHQENYYVFIVKLYEDKSDDELIERMYQYINTL